VKIDVHSSINSAYHGEAAPDALEKDESIRKQVGIYLSLEFLTQLKYRSFRMYPKHSQTISQPKRASLCSPIGLFVFCTGSGPL